ncbi:MAG: glycosyltransferase family 4 protein [Duodenibacillus sp.]|nr:glycosyltransferase family 4 protein [Duodenibacillus sp.]
MNDFVLGLNALRFDGPFCGGQEQALHNLIRGFRENGVGGQIVIFCRRSRKECFSELLPEARVISIPNPRPRRDGLKYKYAKYAERCFHRLYCPWLIRKLGIKAIFYCRTGTPDWSYPIPTAFIPHDIQTQSHPERFTPKVVRDFKRMLEVDLRRRDKVVAISKFDQKEIEDHYPEARGRIACLYNAIIYEDRPLQLDKKGILGVNILHEHKNVETLIRAFARIRDRIDDNLILVGGDNDYVFSLKRFVANAGLQKRVVFEGHVPEERVIELYSSCRLFVNPSLFEGFGMTCVEAMVYGAPTLASAVCSTPEVTRGLCDYYQNPLDELELSEKMLEVLRRPLDPARLKAVSDEMKAAYGYRTVAANYWEFFRGLARGG